MGEGKWLPRRRCARVKRSAGIRIAIPTRTALADIISANASGVTVFWNETALPWARHVIAQGFRNQSAAAGDFSGPGRMDVISGDIENDRKITLFRAPDWKPTLLRSAFASFKAPLSTSMEMARSTTSAPSTGPA